jgi:hypothetical protein
VTPPRLLDALRGQPARDRAARASWADGACAIDVASMRTSGRARQCASRPVPVHRARRHAYCPIEPRRRVTQSSPEAATRRSASIADAVTLVAGRRGAASSTISEDPPTKKARLWWT